MTGEYDGRMAWHGKIIKGGISVHCGQCNGTGRRKKDLSTRKIVRESTKMNGSTKRRELLSDYYYYYY
jgi:hypothetical protein